MGEFTQALTNNQLTEISERQVKRAFQPCLSGIRLLHHCFILYLICFAFMYV